MMHMEIVINASPIILLSKIGRLSLLNNLYGKVYIPDAVIMEVTDASRSDKALNLGTLEYSHLIVANKVAVNGLLGRLHSGEVEVIVGAIEKGIKTVVLDEIAARNKAKQYDLNTIGTLGILMRAKKDGLIDNIETEIEAIRDANMYLSDDLVKRVIDISSNSSLT